MVLCDDVMYERCVCPAGEMYGRAVKASDEAGEKGAEHVSI